MSYRAHLIVYDRDDKRVSPAKVAAALPSLASFGLWIGTRSGQPGHWMDVRKRDDFRYRADRVYRAVDACGWRPVFRVTSAPAYDALRTLLPGVVRG